MTTVEIAEKSYDLESYDLILLSKGPTMVTPNIDNYVLAFPSSKNDPFENSISLNKLEDKEEIYQVVKKYLEDHPEKWIRFDGCCFHYPKKQ